MVLAHDYAYYHALARVMVLSKFDDEGKRV